MTSRSRHCGGLARTVLALVVALVAGFGLAACSAWTGPEKGDCVEKSGDSYAVADCAEASLRVLERFEDVEGDCVPVAGVTESFADYGDGTVLCLGPRDVDPTTAINVAQPGDCVAGVETNSDVRTVDCADPTAESVVLERIQDASTLSFGGDDCSSVPGASSSYSWDMVTTSGGSMNLGAIEGLSVDLLFCLGPAGVDPSTSPDTAQTGDCLAVTSGDPGYAKVDCADRSATYRVVERVDNAILGVEVACASAPDATSGIQRERGPLDGYVLCLAPN
jgi:hypothetical protein